LEHIKEIEIKQTSSL